MVQKYRRAFLIFTLASVFFIVVSWLCPGKSGFWRFPLGKVMNLC